MAFISIYGSKYINGVARLHTELLKTTELKEWYNLYPEKFKNKTNGITQRRWLLKANPELSEFITELLGSDSWIKDLSKLKELEKYADDKEVILRFMDIKMTKKKQLAEFIKREEGIDLDLDSLFDIQIKRLHEYKRQLLNAFHILDLFPAANLSEQISTAGKEASGTGNMKFMLNGCPTIGTYDGANIEIVEEAGEENNFIFGARVEELEEIKESYNPKYYYENVEGLKRVVDTLIDGTFSDNNTGMFKELYEALIEGKEWHKADNYYILKDFESYRNMQMEVDKAFKDKLSYAKKCWINMANSGKFSSDRTILEYYNEIWKF